MKRFVILAAVLTFVAPTARAQETKTFIGVITDTMCTSDHRPMKLAPESKCVKDCVDDGKTYKYALHDGRNTYVLSDQETPAKFAGKKVKITGALYTKTNILKVDRIDATN
jgi:hypothetical protein